MLHRYSHHHHHPQGTYSSRGLPVRSLSLIAGLGTLVRGATATEQARSWEVVLPQHENREHLETRPRSRYSHTASVVGSDIVIAFGYFFDHWDGGRATWLPDVWALRKAPDTESDDDPEPLAWRLVWHAASSHSASPPLRMNHVAVSRFTSSKLVIFGGSGVDGAKMNDIWQLDFEAGEWELLSDGRGAGVAPSSRECLAAAQLLLADNVEAMVIYGGFHLGDTWAFDFRSLAWRLLQPLEDSEEHPGIRAGHAAAGSQGADRMYIYGGNRLPADGMKHQAPGKLDDLWMYSAVHNSWTRLAQENTPGSRQFFAMSTILMEDGTSGLAIIGGSHCDPACKLDSSVFVAPAATRSTLRWRHVQVDPELRGRYHHTATFHHGALWMFGGESYDPITYHNSVLRLPLEGAIATAQKAEL